MLTYPELPLHNNCSELGARVPARYRDISYHTMSDEGKESRDSGMTIIETARKLKVNTFNYIRDRLCKKFQIPSLASLIKANGEAVAYDTS